MFSISPSPSLDDSGCDEDILEAIQKLRVQIREEIKHETVEVDADVRQVTFQTNPRLKNPFSEPLVATTPTVIIVNNVYHEIQAPTPVRAPHWRGP